MNIDLLRTCLANKKAGEDATKAAREITSKAYQEYRETIRRLDSFEAESRKSTTRIGKTKTTHE